MAPLTLQTTLPLNSGHAIPQLGYGVYQTPADAAESVVSHALKVGYRHIDSAIAYRNEARCADAMRASGLKREDIYFTTKVPPKSINYEGAKEALEGSFKETGLDYVDLCLLHAPYGGKGGREGAWKAMVEAKEVRLLFRILLCIWKEGLPKERAPELGYFEGSPSEFSDANSDTTIIGRQDQITRNLKLRGASS
jgi:diketogulonate reductase-like aldo/keto reductase